MAVFVVEFLVFFVQMVAWGLKKVPRKFEEFFKKNDIFLPKIPSEMEVAPRYNC